MSMPRILAKTVDSSQFLVYKDENYSVPVTFKTPNPEDATSFSLICQDPTFISWANNFAPETSKLRLRNISFQRIEKKAGSTKQSKFSRLEFLIETEEVENNGASKETDSTLTKNLVVLDDITAAVLIVYRVNVIVPTGGESTQTVVTTKPREFVLFLEKKYKGIGSTNYIQIPQGHFDETRAFSGDDATILQQIAKLDPIRDYQLIDMTTEGLNRYKLHRDRSKGICTSPNLCGQRCYLYLYRETISQNEINRLQQLSSQTFDSCGIRLTPLSDAWKISADAISLSSLFLFHELRYYAAMPKYRPPREPKKAPVFTCVKDLDPNGQGYNLRVRIADVPPQQVITTTDQSARVPQRAQKTDFIVGDATGCVRFRLTYDQLCQHEKILTTNSKLILRNVNLDMTGGHIAVVVHRFSKIDQPVDGVDDMSLFQFKPNLQNNVSEPEYEEKILDTYYQGQVVDQPPQRSSQHYYRGRRSR